MRSDRLQRIIELKGRLLEEREMVLDEYNRQRDTILSDIASLDVEINVNYSGLYTRCMDGNEFALLKDYLEHLGRLKVEALTQTELIEKKIGKLRAELFELLKEIKMLDTLKEKTLIAARGTENKKHQKLLDDIALRLETRKVQ